MRVFNVFASVVSVGCFVACAPATSEGEGEGEGEEGEGEGEEGEGEDACNDVDAGDAVDVVVVDLAFPAPEGGVPLFDAEWGLLSVEIFDGEAAPGPTGDTLAATIRTVGDTIELARVPGGTSTFDVAIDGSDMQLTATCGTPLVTTGWTSDGIRLELFLADEAKVLTFEQQ